MDVTYADIVDGIMWDRFRAAFKKKFIPDCIWVQKLLEFKQLTQGSITVQQYEIKFNQLS